MGGRDGARLIDNVVRLFKINALAGGGGAKGARERRREQLPWISRNVVRGSRAILVAPRFRAGGINRASVAGIPVHRNDGRGGGKEIARWISREIYEARMQLFINRALSPSTTTCCLLRERVSLSLSRTRGTCHSRYYCVLTSCRCPESRETETGLPHRVRNGCCLLAGS